MRLLLDTHILLWMFEDSPMLSRKARSLLDDRKNVLFCSDVSLWEVAIKNMAHPDGNIGVKEFYSLCDRSDTAFLPIARRHILKTAELAQIHKDPFDRLLLAQAECESMSLVSHDGKISQYPLPSIVYV